MESNENQYLKRLLKKNEKMAGSTVEILNRAQQNYQRKIQDGQYSIKEGGHFYTSKNLKSSTFDRYSMNNMKNDLQKKLNFVDSRIGQLTQLQKNSRIIDQNQRRKFVTQIAKARKNLSRKRQEKIRKNIEKQKERHQDEQKNEKKRDAQQKQQKKSEILKRQESKKRYKQHQHQQIATQNKRLKQKLKEKTLSDKMNDRFHKHEVATTLQERKKKLAQIRSLHKPITKEQFQKHLQKIQEMKSLIEKSASKNNTSRYIENTPKKIYKSVWYKKEQEKKTQSENQKHEEQLYKIKQNKDKLSKYSQYVRKNFKPQISRKKSQELQKKNKSMILNPRKQDARELGLLYLEYSKQHIDHFKQRENSDPEIKKAFRYFNYLEDLKKKHQEKSSQNYIQNIKNKKNLSQDQKIEKMLTYAQALEKKVKIREQMNKINRNLVDGDLDQLYMEAIQAKLSVLEQD